MRGYEVFVEMYSICSGTKRPQVSYSLPKYQTSKETVTYCLCQPRTAAGAVVGVQQDHGCGKLVIQEAVD
jgi:hypothetical protein